MKKFLIIATLFLSHINAVLAQEGDPKPDGSKVEAIKIAWLTKKMNLSPEEAQKFWPIYNKYADEIRRTRVDGKLNKENEIALEEKLLNIRKRYNDEFVKALPSEKVNTFFRADKEFSNYLQKEIMERRQQMRIENHKRLQQ